MPWMIWKLITRGRMMVEWGRSYMSMVIHLWVTMTDWSTGYSSMCK